MVRTADPTKTRTGAGSRFLKNAAPGPRVSGVLAYAIAPAQYHEVDVGDSAPIKCLNNGLWLCQTDGLR